MMLNDWMLSDFNISDIQETSTAISKKHYCHICQKGYSDASNLIRHKRNTHGRDAQPFECQICKVVLKNKHSLTCHIYKTHGCMKKSQN